MPMLFLQTKNHDLPGYLFKFILVDTHSYITHINQNIATFHSRTETFKHFFPPQTIVEWNKLDLWCHKSTYNVLRNHLLRSIWTLSNPICNIHNILWIHFLTRLRLGLSQLNKKNFNRKFDNCINTLYTCTQEIESTTQFFLPCHFYNNICQTT